MAYRRKQGPVAADDHRDSQPQDSATSSYSYTSMKNMHEPKLGLWGALARKAKGILDEDGTAHKFDDYRKDQTPRKFDSSNGTQSPQSRWSFENYGRTERSESRTRSEALAASVNQLGGRIRNALEEGLTIVDNKTANIIEETKKIQIKRNPNGSSSYMQNPAADTFAPPNFSQKQAEASAQETQLKASRNIRMQLETLLAEKARLAQENSMYARENRFLREIVDFHQFTTHDGVSLDVGDMEDINQEEDSNYTYNENMFPVVEAYLAHEEISPVPSRPESPILSPGEPSPPKSSDSPSSVAIANLPDDASKLNALVPDAD